MLQAQHIDKRTSFAESAPTLATDGFIPPELFLAPELIFVCDGGTSATISLYVYLDGAWKLLRSGIVVSAGTEQRFAVPPRARLAVRGTASVGGPTALYVLVGPR